MLFGVNFNFCLFNNIHEKRNGRRWYSDLDQDYSTLLSFLFSFFLLGKQTEEDESTQKLSNVTNFYIYQIPLHALKVKTYTVFWFYKKKLKKKKKSECMREVGNIFIKIVKSFQWVSTSKSIGMRGIFVEIWERG